MGERAEGERERRWGNGERRGMEWRKREMAEINTDNLQNLRGFILVDFEDFLYIKKKSNINLISLTD